MLSGLERWRERQLTEYRHAQIIDRLDQQRLLDEYQRAQALDQMERQNTNLSLLGSILADTDASLGFVQADIARLLAVTDQALPLIVDHLAVVGAQLSRIEQMLASPKETEAWELFRSGSEALASAIEVSEKGSSILSADWLEEAVNDLSRAVETYQHRPEFWFQLGLAYARRGPSQDAAEAFSRCARYAGSVSPGLAAESLLLAAVQLRSIDQGDNARDLLHKFLPVLEQCAEIHLNLAVHHGELERLTRALELAPLLAAVARAEGVASVETAAATVCRQEDGPVSRFQKLESAIQVLAEAAKSAELNYDDFIPNRVALPEFGVDALLVAEVNMPLLADWGTQLANQVTKDLERLEAEVQKCRQRYQQDRTSGEARVMQAKDQAEQACSSAEYNLRLATADSVLAQKVWAAYQRLYDENDSIRIDELARLRAVWQTQEDENWTLYDDDYCLFEWHRINNGGRTGHVDDVYEWAERQPSDMWDKDLRDMPYIELALRMARGNANELRTKAEAAKKSTEDAEACARDARSALQVCIDNVEQLRRLLADGEASGARRDTEPETNPGHELVVAELAHIRNAEAEYNAARVVALRAREALGGPLRALGETIQRATASRNRIRPSQSAIA